MATASLGSAPDRHLRSQELRDAAQAAAGAEVDPSSPASIAVRRALAEPVLRLLRNEEGARLGEDPEAIHQARVATRRLRAQLAAMRPLFPDTGRVIHLRAELAWLGRALGRVRELDVLSARLTERTRSLPSADRTAAERLLSPLEEVRTDARARLLLAMESSRYARLLVALRSLMEEEAGDGTDAGTAFEPLMRKQWKRTKRTVGRLRRDSEDAELHRARILVKRARYAAEAFAPVFGRRATRFARRAAALQDVLGAHQDAVVAEAWIRTHSRFASPRVAFAAGELAAAERRARIEARLVWPDAWKRLRRRNLRFWG
jgi:CHAD domain-containing protein